MIISSRRIDYHSWLPEEYICIEKKNKGFELSIKVNSEIDITEDDYKDLTEYDEDGCLKDGCDYNFILPDFINGKEVSGWELDWSGGNYLIVFSTELEYSEVWGGYEPLIIHNNEQLDSKVKIWFEKYGFETLGGSNSSFNIKFNDLLKKINDFILS